MVHHICVTDMVRNCKYHFARHENVWGNGRAASLIRNLYTRWGELSTSRLGARYCENHPRYLLSRRLVGPRVTLDDLDEREIRVS